MDRVGGILLAGGASRRLPPDKLLMTVDGEPLWWHALRALSAATDEVIVVMRHDGELPPGPPLSRPMRIVRDRLAARGPLAALVDGLTRCATQQVIVAAADTPRLPPAILDLLRERLAVTPADAVALVHDGERRPLPLALRRDAALPAAERALARGERSLRGLLADLRVEGIDEGGWRAADPDGLWQRDIDTPGDLTSV